MLRNCRPAQDTPFPATDSLQYFLSSLSLHEGYWEVLVSSDLDFGEAIVDGGIATWNKAQIHHLLIRTFWLCANNSYSVAFSAAKFACLSNHVTHRKLCPGTPTWHLEEGEVVTSIKCARYKDVFLRSTQSSQLTQKL